MIDNNNKQKKSVMLYYTMAIFFVFLTKLQAQEIENKEEKFSVHYQTTIITQHKPTFNAKYTDTTANTLLATKETQTTLTSTIFLGAKLWKGASIFMNGEISGGSGLSKTFGVADATNGEAFRVGSAEPKVYLARLYLRQVFALTNSTTYQTADFNQLAGKQPTNYFAVNIGKMALGDFFDDNAYSHDPRTQFLSWTLMDSGAWDYAANTRGYTSGIILEYVTPKNELRYGMALLPLTANGPTMNWNLNNSRSQNLEYTRRYLWKNRVGAFRILSFLNSTNMGNYNQSLALSATNPDITSTRKFGNKKYGFAISADQALTDNLGAFLRASWSDGHTETWAFTEVDRSICVGLSSNGNKWKRQNDNVGLAFVTSGISAPHQNYLAAGGKGFMLGDGKLNYGWERLAEVYYSAELVKNNIYLTGTYQFLMNPGYNKDRGPANVFSIRVHAQI